MIKAVIFDIDGVLLDSFKANHKFFQNVLKKYGYKVPSYTQYKRTFHLTMHDTLRLYAKNATEGEFKAIWNTALTMERPTHLFKQPDSVAQTLKVLSKRYKIGIATSRVTMGVDIYFKFSKTKKFFGTVVHFGHYKNPKPHPEPLLLAAKRLKVKARDSVYIGDTLADIKSANAAGMKMILFSKKKLKGADAVTNDFIKLPSIIKKLVE